MTVCSGTQLLKRAMELTSSSCGWLSDWRKDVFPSHSIVDVRDMRSTLPQKAFAVASPPSRMARKFSTESTSRSALFVRRGTTTSVWCAFSSRRAVTVFRASTDCTSSIMPMMSLRPTCLRRRRRAGSTW